MTLPDLINLLAVLLGVAALWCAIVFGGGWLHSRWVERLDRWLG